MRRTLGGWGVIERKEDRKGPVTTRVGWEMWPGSPWENTFALAKSVSLAVKCHGDSKRGLQAGAEKPANGVALGCVLCGQHPGLQSMNLLLTFDSWKALQ